VRTSLGLAPDVPLIVYSGVSAPRRGLATVVEALDRLPGAHLALVTTRNAYVEGLLARAAELGVADRLHLHGYVPQEQVVAFLRTATVGVIPIHHTLNHEIALITKYFEYAHARLPIVTSDVETMARQTQELGNGEVFRAEDVPDFVRACGAVLADPGTYAKAYDSHPDLLRSWTWRTQAEALAELYRRLLASDTLQSDTLPANGRIPFIPAPGSGRRPGAGPSRLRSRARAVLRRPVRTARRLLARTAARRDGTADTDTRRAEAARIELDAGRTPPDLGSVVEVLARQADVALRRAPAAAVEPLTQAAALAFHRTLHFDGLTSPLADSPDALLAPLRAGAAWRRATAPRGRSQPAAQPLAEPAAQPLVEPAAPDQRVERPHRLLVVTFKNWKFLEPIARHYEGRHDVEVRRLDLADLPGAPWSPLQQLRLRLTGPDDARALAWARPLAEAVDWADTVFLDWLQRGAVALTAIDPGRARIVVRLHSFEAFTVFPHLVDYSRVDDLVVVGDHLGRFVDRVVPAAQGPARHVLANAVDLTRFTTAKDDDARFTLALVGYGVVAKDPLWAVETLAALRRNDSRYRLLLVGADFEVAAATATGAARDYHARLAARLAEPDVAGAVERIAFTDDVPGLLRRVGVMVSSSVRESFHLALVEGAASGAVPVVRDWPLFAAVGGPSGLFPADWVVTTPEQAAERVLATTADPAGWRAEGARCAQWVLDRYDWRVTRPRYDALLTSRVRD
jgi:glycosyltransferase involved in cell wall biosynthesis